MPTLPPAARTVSPNLRPLACSEFKVVNPHLGKITPAGMDDVKLQDVLDRITGPDWEAQLRRLFGDTDETISGSKQNNAAWHALCDRP